MDEGYKRGTDRIGKEKYGEDIFYLIVSLIVSMIVL